MFMWVYPSVKSGNIWKQGQDKIPLECSSFAWPWILGNKRRNLTLFSSCSVFRNLFFLVTFSLLLINITYARFINNNDIISSKITFFCLQISFFPIVHYILNSYLQIFLFILSVTYYEINLWKNLDCIFE